MSYRWIGWVCLILAGCTLASPPAIGSQPTEDTMSLSSLPNLGAAPELTNDVWLNVEQPLRLVDLRGKVILLDMWTFG